MPEATTNVEEEFNEPTIGFAKFLNPGDVVIGTYTGKQLIPAKGIYKEQYGYNLLVEGNEIVCAFEVEKAKKYIDKCMKGAKIGQRVKFVFEGWFKTDAYNKELERVGGKVEDCKISPAKTIKVFLGKMDTAYLDGFNEDKEIAVSAENIDFTK
jgi:hypothetical protein